jgi:hypothetical protein
MSVWDGTLKASVSSYAVWSEQLMFGRNPVMANKLKQTETNWKNWNKMDQEMASLQAKIVPGASSPFMRGILKQKWNKLKQNWNKLKQTETNWNKLKQIEPNWTKHKPGDGELASEHSPRGALPVHARATSRAEEKEGDALNMIIILLIKFMPVNRFVLRT